MTYELRFENHDPVLVANGYGFKAPKSWGRQVFETEDEVEIEGIDDPADPLRELNKRIQKEELKLQKIVDSNQNHLDSIFKEVELLDVRIITASGVGHEAQLQNQRLLKIQSLNTMRAETLTETTEQRERVARLKELRSNKRKDLAE